MNITTSHISLFKLTHRSTVHIGLRFAYQAGYVQKIKQLEGRKYSKTHSCWYIPYTKESFTSFKKLGIPFKIENAESKKSNPQIGTVEKPVASQRPHTYIESNTLDSSSESRPTVHSDGDILVAKTPRLSVRYNYKAFLFDLPYNSLVIKELKTLKRVWWNPAIQKWLVYGSIENLCKIQTLFQCFSKTQMALIENAISAFEPTKKIVFSRIPQRNDVDYRLPTKLETK